MVGVDCDGGTREDEPPGVLQHFELLWCCRDVAEKVGIEVKAAVAIGDMVDHGVEEIEGGVEGDENLLSGEWVPHLLTVTTTLIA